MISKVTYNTETTVFYAFSGQAALFPAGQSKETWIKALSSVPLGVGAKALKREGTSSGQRRLVVLRVEAAKQLPAHMELSQGG